jgi:alcohol dehydrogenase class IV
MVEFLRKETPEQVIAVGGGSVMDAAKAAYLVFQTGMPLEDCFGMNKFSSVNPGKKLKKVFCFPTTSGTGSEVTPYSNIVDRNLEVKKLIVEKEIIPEFSFLIPEFTYSMPHDVTLATAFDAMAHSIEGFLNTGQDNNHPKANKWALESIKLIVEHLPRVLADSENRESREALAAAACLGGMVIRYKSTGLPHLCSFSWFGKIAHGIAVSVLLPYAWSYYLGNEKVKARTMELEGVFPGDVKTASDIIKNYIDFAQSSGIRPALKFYPEITPELLRVTARTAGENKMKLDLAPKPVPLEKSFEILSGILKDAREGTIRDAEKF